MRVVNASIDAVFYLAWRPHQFILWATVTVISHSKLKQRQKSFWSAWMKPAWHLWDSTQQQSLIKYFIKTCRTALGAVGQNWKENLMLTVSRHTHTHTHTHTKKCKISVLCGCFPWQMFSVAKAGQWTNTHEPSLTNLANYFLKVMTCVITHNMCDSGAPIWRKRFMIVSWGHSTHCLENLMLLWKVSKYFLRVVFFFLLLTHLPNWFCLS